MKLNISDRISQKLFERDAQYDKSQSLINLENEKIKAMKQELETKEERRL